MRLYSHLNLVFIRLLTVLVPRFLLPPCALFWGGLFYLFLGRKRGCVRKNLRVVTGRRRVESLVFATFYNFAINWCDIMLMGSLKGKRLFGLIGRQSGDGPLQEALAAGRGAILISMHLGNWELGGLGLAAKGYRLNILTFREPDEKVNRQRAALRLERGMNFIYVDRQAPSSLAMIEAVNALNRNEVLAILGERDGASRTVELDFFGRPTPIPVGAAYLALASGAPVIPVFIPREGSRYLAVMEKPIRFQARRDGRERAVREGMSLILRVFERYVRAYPSQWYNFYDYWARHDLVPPTPSREGSGSP